MNPGVSGVLCTVEVTKPSDVNKVTSNQRTSMKPLILQLALMLRTGVSHFASTAFTAVLRGVTLIRSVETHD